MRQAKLRRLGVVLACLSLTCAAGAVTPPAATPATGSGMLGFTSAGASHQRQLEQPFDSMLSAGEMRGWLKQLSSEPNQVGSSHDIEPMGFATC